MPIKKEVNKNFFKTWSGDMSYVLGFFAADGSMLQNNRGACFIDFKICDLELLEKIKKSLESNHKISKILAKNKNWKNIYRLQIGSKDIFKDLEKIGFYQAKTKNLNFPKIPREFFGDFVRGYFDGDGCISYGYYSVKDRDKKKFIFSVRFTCGDKSFLEILKNHLKDKLQGGFIVNKERGYELVYSHKDSLALFDIMYNNVSRCIFLERKYEKFKKIQRILRK